jgi:hypothetical protein
MKLIEFERLESREGKKALINPEHVVWLEPGPEPETQTKIHLPDRIFTVVGNYNDVRTKLEGS